LGTSPYADPAVAATYALLAVPFQFAPPARDLVSLLELAPGHRVLDVGTGSGLVAALAQAVVKETGLVVGVDWSMPMLRAADHSRSRVFVVARVPGLPFADRAFDRVAGSFVVSHFTDYRDGLADMMRVCRAGGRVGVTAWGGLGNAPGELWSAVAMKHISPDTFRGEFRAEIPWDDWFADAARLEQALTDAGLARIEVARREYSFSVKVDEYLQVRETSVQGAILRRHLDRAGWEGFRRDMASEFGRQFPTIVEWTRDVHFAIGTVIDSR
jgi:SAM-dependent methyltransferase